MAILALAQRSVILMLEDEVALLSNKLAIEYNENDDDIDKFQENLKKIKRLQATYVKVQNQLLLSEITVQEQGCEMYEMLREQLYLEKNMNDLDIGMRNLRDVADIANAYFERQHDKKEMAMRKSQLEEQKRSEREEEEKRQKDEKSAERRFNRLALLFGISSIWEPFAMMFFDIEARCGYILWFVATLAFLTVIYIWYYKDNFKKKNSNHNPDGSA
jgi:cation transport ATPase